MVLFNHPEFDGHEQVVFSYDPISGLKSIIAIHNTNLGPALGGCRFWNYASDEDALTDVLRLSKGMSYKSAMAGLPLGGGKAVILGNPSLDKTPEKLMAFGRHVDQLNGRYITGEDVGTLPQDMVVVSTQTKYVTGIPSSKIKEECSYVTALGVFKGIEASALHKFGKSSLAGVKVSVQGLGQVGGWLVQLLHESGAVIYATDVNQDRLGKLQEKYRFHHVDLEDIYTLDVDVFAPCALGGVLNERTIPKLQCKIVAGCANNQLLSPSDATLLMERDILYAPDYVINAGGLIHSYYELTGYDFEVVHNKLNEIPKTLRNVFKESEKKHQSTQEISDRMAVVRMSSR